MKQILKNRLNVVLISGIAILYVVFLGMDIFYIPKSIQASYLKYVSMILCLMLAISLMLQSENKRDSGHVVLALSFTLVADIFLLFTNHDIPGVFFFCLVQLTYLKRYHRGFFKVGMGLVIGAMMVHLLFPFQPLYVIAGLYALLIVSCFLATFRTKLPKFNLYCVRIGMALFILCDIHVALYHQLSRSSGYYVVAAIVIWLFYLPSQLMLAMSAGHVKVVNY